MTSLSGSKSECIIRRKLDTFSAADHDQTLIAIPQEVNDWIRYL